jgi:hypothetical protein
MQNGVVSEAWSKLGGGPSDLVFPEEFLGTWVVFSKLTKVDTPLGEDMVQDMDVVRRAMGDIGKEQRYPLRFVRNSLGKVVFDRSYNTVKLAEELAGKGVMKNVKWNVDDPNTLEAFLGDGTARKVFVRVTKRSEDTPAPDRIETSEVLEQVFDDTLKEPKVKSSRCYTKWKFRPIEQAGEGPAIVASQTVYDYLTGMDLEDFIESQGKAVTEYAYRMQMFPASKYPQWDSKWGEVGESIQTTSTADVASS